MTGTQSFSSYIRFVSNYSLARKYRPQGFDDVIAQEHITRTLRNALLQERLGAAYLFCGVRGTGKTTCARILAKAVNCEKGPTDTPCGLCASCNEITSGQGMDVLEIDAASNTGVDDVRTLRENVRYLPTRGKRRVFIIDEVHRLSGAAFDALLKTLEEPPSHVLFIFATTEPLKVPDTILSRTQRFDFRRVSVDDLAGHLLKIAAAENLQLQSEAARLIARKGEGSVRDALSLLDHAIAFAGTTITAETVGEALGLVDAALIIRFLRTVVANDSKGSLAIVGTLFKEGVDIEDFLVESVEIIRLLLHSKVNNVVSTELAGHDQAAELFSEVTLGDLVRYAQILQETKESVDRGIDEHLAMDLLAIRLAELKSTVSLDALLDLLPEQNTQNEMVGSRAAVDVDKPVSRASHSAPASSQPPVRSTTTAQPIKSVQPVAAPRMENLPEDPWPRLLVAVRKHSPMLSSQLSMAEPQWEGRGILRLQFPNEQLGAYQWVQRADQSAILTKTIRELFGQGSSWTSEVGESLPSAPDDRTEAQRSPQVLRLLEKVDGEIVSVRKSSQS